MPTNQIDLSKHGYQIVAPLGENIQGGRATYKALDLSTNARVVIKQFRFFSGDWSDYKQIEREIETLQKLDHPGIPRYLNSFDSGEGICLVQEYIEAEPLSSLGQCLPSQVEEIALAVLSILEYLQKQIPPIVHRDLKPENILVNRKNERLQLYLVDFGLARVGCAHPTALSTVVAGTPGFMPPEMVFNKPVSLSSDLYSLGITLICLLTGKSSTEILELFDNSFEIDWQHLTVNAPSYLVRWLEKITQIEPNARFDSATSACQALIQAKKKSTVNCYQESSISSNLADALADGLPILAMLSIILSAFLTAFVPQKINLDLHQISKPSIKL